MRGQLGVEQVGHVQVHQLLARERLQHALQARQFGAERRTCAGDPVKAPRGRLGGQLGQFLRLGAGLQVEDADRLRG